MESYYSDTLWNLNFSRTVAGITKWFWVTISFRHKARMWQVLPPVAKPSRSRRGESLPSSPGGKSRIEYLGDLIGMVSMVIGPTKFIGDLTLDPRRCSGPSRGATSATSLWWKAVEGLKLNHKSNLGWKFNYDSWFHDMEFLSIACRRSIEAPLLLLFHLSNTM